MKTQWNTFVQVLVSVSVTFISTLAFGPMLDVIYYLENSGYRMVELHWENFGGQWSVIDCKLYGDSNLIRSILQTDWNKRVILTDPLEMNHLVETCQVKQQAPDVLSGSQDSSDSGLKKFAIFPGTKWCGAGNIAKNNDDLGEEKATDMCCREHDRCGDNIKAGGTKHGLKNPDLYTRSNCACDNKFYDCQRATGAKASNVIGNLYFNLLKVKCFNLSHPIVECLNYQVPLVRSQCTEYKLDTSKKPIWQFFDARVF